MHNDILPQAEKYTENHKRHKTWKKIVTSLACVVVFVTTYMLILPAITMEQTAYCGNGEHQHNENCYEKQLICGYPEETEAVHVHEEECYQQEQILICNLEEIPGHVHDENCIQREQVLICSMTPHVHGENCYQTEQVQICTATPHIHGDGCYQTEQILVCTEDHEHMDSCYEQQRTMICSIEEHEHSDTCYEQRQILVCSVEEHEHGETCYQTQETYICGMTEGEGAHTHGTECYETRNVLVCEQEESTPVHTHTDDCYKKVLVCKKEEHTHTLSCFSDPNADLESYSTWERSLSGIQLTGNWADDVIAVAKSQLGYTESTRNYLVNEAGKIKGYSRYGAWYGDPYGDWCAMFVSFCLHYAEVPIPYGAYCPGWISSLSGIYHSASDYLPKKGDIIFFDYEGDGISDHVGLVTEVYEDGSIKTIEGNSSNCVQYVSYSLGYGGIMGYAELPENPEMIQEETQAETQEETQVEIQEETQTNSEMQAENQVALLMTANDAVTADNVYSDDDASGDDSDMTTADGSDETTTRNSDEQSLNVISTSGSATYNKDKDTYTVDMIIDFTIDNSDPDTVTKTSYVYTYPVGYPVPAALTEGSHTLHDKNGNNAGTYFFRDNNDGTFSVVIQISETYAKADTTGNTITGYVSYRGTMDGDAEDEEGKLVIGSGTEQVIIPAENITYPDGETHNYNVQTEKSGEYKVENNQLIYTVKVYSTKGTPGDIDFEDTLVAEGLTLGTPTVTVQMMSRKDHQNGWIEEWVVTETPLSVSPSYSEDNKTISMILPELDTPIVDSDNVKEDKGYFITYIYDLSDADAVSLTVNNKIQVSSNGGNDGPTVKDDASTNVGVDRTLTFEKSGSYDRSTGTIQWTLKVNNNKTNIAGATITDEMFGAAVNGTIKVEPDSGYTYANNTITFTPTDGSASNNQTYTITYSTVVYSDWDEQIISNNATFDPTPDNSNSGDEITKTSDVTIHGGSVEKTKVSETIADDRQSAVVEWKVTINVPDSGLPAGTEITDIAGDKIWMTRAQLTDWNCVLYWQDTNGNTASSTSPYNIPGANVIFYASNGHTYTFSEISENQDGELEKLNYQLKTIQLDEKLTPPTGATKLVFIYKTTVDLSDANDGWNKYTNTVKVEDKEASAEFNYEVKTPTLSKTHSNPTYTEADGQIKYVNIPWTVTIEVPDTGWLAGKTLIDDLTRNEWNTGDVHGITYQEAVNMVTGAKWENGTAVTLTDESVYEVKFVTEDNGSYTYQQLCEITDETLKNSLAFISFTITPLKVVTRPENETKIILNVTSRADISDVETGGNKYYRNLAYVGNNKANDEYQYINRQNSVVKYDGNWKNGDTPTSSDGDVYWIVEVQLNNQEHYCVSVSDTLPENVVLDSMKVSIDSKGDCYPAIGTDGVITGAVNGYTVSGTYDQFTRAICLEVVKTDNSAIDFSKIQFYFNCLVDDKLKDKSAHILKNDVTAKVDDTEIGSSSQTQNWTFQEQTVTHDVVTKSGKWDNNARFLEYQVVINPDGKELVPDSDTLLTLIDELTYNHRNSGYQVANNNGGTDWVSADYHFQVNLLQNRVKLYYAKRDENGNLETDNNGVYLTNGEVEGWSWTFDASQLDDWRTTNTLTITGIPDSVPLIMEYVYQVSSDLPDKAYIQNLPISNTAKLLGNDQIGYGSHSGGEWKEQTTTGEIDSNKKTLKLVKVEQGHYENVLSDAEFTVYLATGTSESGELLWSEAAVRVYATDASGSFSIEYEETNEDGTVFTYVHNTLYKVVETKAPDGYLIPDTAEEYYFYFSDENDTTYALPENLPTGSMDLSKSAFTVYAENVKDATEVETTEITVEKKWLGSDGNEITENLPENITVQLYQKSSAITSGDSGGGSSSEETGGTGVSCIAECTDGNQKTCTFDKVSIGDTVKISVVYTWNAGEYDSMTGHAWAWTGVSDGTGVWSTTDGNNNDTYTYTCKITSSEITFNTGDQISSIKKVTCDLVSSGTSSDSGSTTYPETSAGTAYGDPISISSPDWSYTWKNLPKTGVEDGKTVNYAYYIKEISVPGYTIEYTNNEGITDGTITVTNKKDKTEDTTTSITMNKVWQRQDNNGDWIDKTENLPTSISVYLKCSNDGGTTWTTCDADNTDESNETPYIVQPDSDGNWTLSVVGLPVKDDDGNTLIYAWEEVQLPGYEPPEYENSEDGKTTIIINKKIPETSITVNKSWEVGVTEQDVDVQLYRYESDTQPEENVGDPDSGTDSSDTATTITLRSDTVTLPSGDSWWFYDINRFTEFETAQDGYFSVYSNNAAIKLVFQGDGTTSWKGAEISAIKVDVDSDGSYISTFSRVQCMEGIKSAEMDLSAWVKLFLCADPNTNTTVTKVEWTTVTTASGTGTEENSYSAPGGGNSVGSSVTLNSSCNWSHTWDNLPLYGYKTVTENGLEIQKKVYYTYYVKETSTGYSPTYSEDSPLTGGTLVITNHSDNGGGDTPGYTLPETGGPGTIRYILGGILLMGTAGILLLYNKNKRRKEDMASS